MPHAAFSTPSSSSPIPNGSGAAAVLAAGIGSFALSILAIAADRMPAFQKHMIFYRPSGPLSGVTTTTLLIWALVWAILDLRWRKHNVRLSVVGSVALVLLALSLLLTFPPFADLL